MTPQNKNLLIAGVVIALIIGIMSPYIASTNPDGLEKSQQQINPNFKEPGYYKAPFSDYTVSELGNNPFAGIVALIIGILVVLILVYLVAWIIKRRNLRETSK
jgi:cobalt/nickel transport protein